MSGVVRHRALRRACVVRTARRAAATLLGAVAIAVAIFPAAVRAADDLHLAPGLSFTDDSSDAFPIRGRHLDDATTGDGKATIVFFGTSNCWNTNREAERLISLYPKYKDRVRFVVVDVAHPSDAQKPLIEKHYKGAIPTVAVLAPDGSVLYDRAGETAATRGDAQPLAAIIESALPK
ncbi:hypothetical protein K2Z84_26135 [Candidatus Binatia bacterium]|nr:hypothetical protein [Candidatus Binatia bacterium]